MVLLAGVAYWVATQHATPASSTIGGHYQKL